MKKNRGHYFNEEVTYKGHSLRIEGDVTPGSPATGPTYDCGGYPGDPPCIEDYTVYLIHIKKDGKHKERKIEDTDGKIIEAVHDELHESAHENSEPDWDAINDAKRDREWESRESKMRRLDE